MTPEFNRWWDADELMQKNPYRKDTPKIDGRMSDGKIYTEVSRKSNPEAHARIDALIATL